MQTRTETSTSTHAQHIASKVAADLKRIQRIYRTGRPTDSEISAYQEEIALLLYRGYLGSVTYGFQKGTEWVVALKYTAGDGNLSGGDDPGGIGYEGDVSNANFTSFLSYSDSWGSINAEDRQAFENLLPFKRVGGVDPGAHMSWEGSRNYSSGDINVKRTMARRI